MIGFWDLMTFPSFVCDVTQAMWTDHKITMGYIHYIVHSVQ